MPATLEKSAEQREVRGRWREYVRTRAPELREAIIHEYAILARRAVDRLQITPWGCVSQEDLLSYAVIGLIDAVDRFDPEQNVPFEGFAMPRIRGAVIDALRKLDWVPRTVRLEETKLRKAYGRLEALLGRPPTDAEVARDLGVSIDELEHLVTEVARGSVLSLDDLVAGMGETPGHTEEPRMQHTLDPHYNRERGEARTCLVEALEGLPEREKLVVSLYYFHDLTLKEVGKVLGVTEQRVSQLHAKAMLRLSHKLTRHSELLGVLAP